MVSTFCLVTFKLLQQIHMTIINKMQMFHLSVTTGINEANTPVRQVVVSICILFGTFIQLSYTQFSF